MNNLKLLKQIEFIEKVNELAKNIAIDLGADKNAFNEADAKLAEIKKEVKGRLQGGIISKESSNETVIKGSNKGI